MTRPVASPLGYVEPMPPSLVDTPPEGGAWIHEIKYDGDRTEPAIDGKAIRASTRTATTGARSTVR